MKKGDRRTIHDLGGPARWSKVGGAERPDFGNANLVLEPTSGSPPARGARWWASSKYRRTISKHSDRRDVETEMQISISQKYKFDNLTLLVSRNVDPLGHRVSHYIPQSNK